MGKVAKTSKRKELTRESICLNAGLKKGVAGVAGDSSRLIDKLVRKRASKASKIRLSAKRRSFLT